ncbi:MAG: MFS transporter [Candidatus Cloacimonetes bacterium]|nr:MFS transporter [Candidatus Cloacimonadota bacterium]
MNAEERKNLSRLFVATLLNGCLFSLGTMQDIIAKKALGALDWQIALLAVVWPVSNFFSIWWGKILERSENKAPYFFLVAVLGRLVLLLTLWVTHFWHLLIILVILYSFNALYIPLQNSMLQRAFSARVRGRVFGWMSSITTLVVVLLSFFGGRLLDVNEGAYRPMFAIFGIVGFVGTSMLAFIRYTNPAKPVVKEPLSLSGLLLGPIKRAWLLLHHNRGFALFELSYFIYGMGFLLIIPVIPRYLVTDLGMDYTQSFLAKGVIAQLGIMLLSPLAGRLHDNRHPLKYSAVAFALLALYPMLLLASSFAGDWSHMMVYLAFACFGVAMAGVNISWNLGSIYFAGDEDASMYQSVHVTLTGVRGALVPFMGLGLMRLAGIRAVFLTAVVLQLTAASINWRKCRRGGKGCEGE